MIIKGDCIEEMKKLESNSVDAIITDPPYGLEFMGKNWDKFKHGNKIINPQGAFEHKKGFKQMVRFAKDYETMIKMQQFFFEWATECLRILKPGGFLLSFGGTRTYHRLVCGIEDAGFEIRDTIMYLYGSGFPKSLNIGKQIDKMQGNEREILEPTGRYKHKFKNNSSNIVNTRDIADNNKKEMRLTKGNSEWEGWGTAMKPSHEDIVVAQKPLNTIPLLLNEIQCQLNLLVKNVGKNLELNQVEQKEEMLSSVQKDAQKKKDSKEVMDTSQLKTKEESGYLNTMSLWKNLLEEISNEMNKSITLMEKEMTTDLRILNSLLGQVIQENIIHQQKSQVNGLTANALLVENNFKSVLIKSRLLNITSVQDNVILKELELSPNSEPIVVARKPLSEKNVALNVLKHGTGGLNIDECRIKHNEDLSKKGDEHKLDTQKQGWGFKSVDRGNEGRFPANIILDEEAGKMLDEQSGESLSKGGQSFSKTSKIYGEYSNDRTIKGCGYKDKGGASRFFYCAKASKSEREKHNNHPTVKPIKLMEYLIKLVSRKGAIVLDPFLGSGTTAIACLKLERQFIGIEKEEEYIKISQTRIKPFLEQTKLIAKSD